jgi:nuclear transcription factor Y gamma
MISAEAPILFAKACELFITDVTFRALFYTNFHKRKTLQKSDISTTVSSHEMFDFLIDVLPREDNDKDFIGKREPERSRGDNMFKMITKNSYTLDHNPALMRNPLSAQAPLRSQFPRIPEISDPHDFDRELDTRSLVASSLLPFTKK